MVDDESHNTTQNSYNVSGQKTVEFYSIHGQPSFKKFKEEFENMIQEQKHLIISFTPTD
jgi:hypothetical protein